MNEFRQDQIRKNLTMKSILPDEKYDNAELLQKLLEYQNALAENVFVKLHADHLDAKDVLSHFKCLAEKYGLDTSEEFLRFNENMVKLQNKIRALINGQKGEHDALDALQLVSLEKDVEILSNIEIELDNDRTEYDEIVITPNGLFVIEVKNYKHPMKLTAEGNFIRQDGIQYGPKYNLGVKMNKKEFLLKSLLPTSLAPQGIEFPIPYEGIVLYANNDSNLIDEYKQIPICYCSTISQHIKNAVTDGPKLTADQIQMVKETILKLHTPRKYNCEFSCEEITNDFAYLMTAIEDAADLVSNNQSFNLPEDATDETCKKKISQRKKILKYMAIASSLAVGTIGIVMKGRV